MIGSLLVGLLVIVALYVGSHKLSGAEALLAAVAFVGGAVLIIFPWIASYLALRLNVGRGVDLVLYVAIVLNAFVIANFYFRFKRDEQTIVQLVRAIALQNPGLPEKNDAPSSALSTPVAGMQVDLLP